MGVGRQRLESRAGRRRSGGGLHPPTSTVSRNGLHLSKLVGAAAALSWEGDKIPLSRSSIAVLSILALDTAKIKPVPAQIWIAL